jgi:hypothetical protein
MYSTGGSEGAVKWEGLKNICYAAINKWWTVAYVCIQLEGVKVQSSGRDWRKYVVSPLINGGRCMYSTGRSEGTVKRAGMKNISCHKNSAP